MDLTNILFLTIYERIYCFTLSNGYTIYTYCIEYLLFSLYNVIICRILSFFHTVLKILSECLKKHGSQAEYIPLHVDLNYSRFLSREVPVLRVNVCKALAVVVWLWTLAAHLATAWGTSKELEEVFNRHG